MNAAVARHAVIAVLGAEVFLVLATSKDGIRLADGAGNCKRSKGKESGE